MPRKPKSPPTTAEMLALAERELAQRRQEVLKWEQTVDELRMAMYAELAALGTPHCVPKPPPRSEPQDQQSLKFGAPEEKERQTA